MTVSQTKIDEIKHRIRQLKKLECKIRFGKNDAFARNPAMLENGRPVRLVWDEYFILNNKTSAKAQYDLNRLAGMTPDEFNEVISAFFWSVYYRYYQENGIMNQSIYDPAILAKFGLPGDADSTAVKKRFRELAKRYHPDTGGDSARFIEMIENYRQLTEC